jgi:hypothetical protein
MEYVKNAIEKAREDREKNVAEGEATEERELLPESAKPELDDDAAISIDHATTRTSRLNNKALIDNRVVAAFDSDERAEPYRQ